MSSLRNLRRLILNGLDLGRAACPCGDTHGWPRPDPTAVRRSFQSFRSFQSSHSPGVSTPKPISSSSSNTSMSSPPSLRSVLLLEHDIAQSCAFFREGLGAKLGLVTEAWAEIEVGGGTPSNPSVLLHVKRRETAAATTAATKTTATTTRTDQQVPTPILVFTVDDVQDCLVKMLAHGGEMDGRIEYGVDGTTQAVVRTPGGTLVGLVSNTYAS